MQTKTISVMFAAAVLLAGTASGAMAGRAGSHRVGGYGAHGKGSHYVGGHRPTAVGRFLHRHL